jgi:integrase
VVYKRPGKSNSWYADLTHPLTGARVRQSLKFSGSKREAEKLAARLQAELDTTPAAVGKAISCREATDRYIAKLQSQGSPFARELLCTQRKLFAPADNERWRLAPDLMLHQLTPSLMEELVVARAREGNKPQTIRHEIGLLRSASRYAAELGFKTPEAMTKGAIKNPWRMPKVTQKTRYLSPEEFQRVYDYLDPEAIVSPPQLLNRLRSRRQDCRDLLVALAYTGGRWSEVASLKWPQVDLERGIITLWGNKTQQERAVPIAAPLRGVLERLQGGPGLSSSLALAVPSGPLLAMP